MAGIIVDEGIAILNELLASAIETSGYVIGLFASPTSISRDTVYGDIVPTTFPGYSFAALAVASEDVPGSPTPHVDTEIFAPVVFTRSSGAGTYNVYGYYIWDAGSTLVAVQLFATPIAMTTPGQTIIVIPQLSYQDIST